MALQRSALPLPDDTPLRLRCAGGLVENLAAVKAEYLHYRRVTPLRIVLAGPPCSGAHGAAAAIVLSVVSVLTWFADLRDLRMSVSLVTL